MKKTIYIDGMTCNHCVGHVKTALEGVCGISSVEVDIQEKKAVAELHHEIDNEKIESVINEAGYKVTSIE